MSGHPYLLVGDDGEPLGMVDIDQIQTEGTALAFAFAGYSDDPEALDKIQADTLTRIGARSFGYVCASALRVMTEQILSPTCDVADAHGVDVRTAMRDISEGRTPS